MKTVKALYLKEVKPKKKKRIISPIERLKIRKEMKALNELAGMWADKDTSFFDKR